jgi:hypothetical protein
MLSLLSTGVQVFIHKYSHASHVPYNYIVHRNLCKYVFNLCNTLITMKFMWTTFITIQLLFKFFIIKSQCNSYAMYPSCATPVN